MSAENQTNGASGKSGRNTSIAEWCITIAEWCIKQCRLTDDQRSARSENRDPTDTDFSDWAKPYDSRWKEKFLEPVVQVVLLCGSIALVENIEKGRGVEWELVARSVELVLRVWPWAWLIITAVSFTTVHFSQVIKDEIGRESKGAKGKAILDEYELKYKVTTSRVMVFATDALSTVVERACENLYVIIVVIGCLLFGPQLLGFEFGYQKTPTRMVLFGGLAGVIMLGALVKCRPLINKTLSRYIIPRYVTVVDIVRFLVVLVAAWFLSLNMIVLFVGVLFVLLQIPRDWLQPSILYFVAFGFAQRFTLVRENSSTDAGPLLECLLDYAEFLPTLTVIAILGVAVGRWLAMFQEKFGLDQLKLAGRFGISILVLGTPIALGLNLLQGWLFAEFREAFSNGATPDSNGAAPESMLALITIAGVVPAALVTATIWYYRRLVPDVGKKGKRVLEWR